MSRARSPKPKHQRIFEQLSHDLMSGRYRPGQKFPSEAALVRRFGASRITVGHALRELQQRGFIDRVAGSGTYVRSVAQRREGLLFGLIIPNLGETEIFEPICHGIASSPNASGHALLWPHVDTNLPGKEEQAVQLCMQCIAHNVSGVFFAPLELSERSREVNRRILKLLRDAAIPVVFLDRRPDESPFEERCDLAGIDNQRAGYLATNHLLQLGSRKIGFVAYRHQASTVKARIEGYKEALAALSGDRGDGRIFYAAPNRSLDLPAKARNCDAFVCANDRVAGHLMHALLSQGTRIPENVRLVGIDDVNYASLLPVPLTTVHQPCHEIGEAALRLMLERMERPKMAARNVLLDGSLVIRESCGANAATGQEACPT
jgi:GntR family transcriptional regulator of arabinose operon